MKSRFSILTFVVLAMVSFTELFAQALQQRPSNWAVKVETCQLKNLYRLNDSIYRSEQPDQEAFACLARAGFRSVLNLRSHHVDSVKIGTAPMNAYTVKMTAKSFTPEEVVSALRILKDGPKPMLVHCLHGSDRTGVVIAMYRIVFENWTKEQAIEELQQGGYGFHTQYTNMIAYLKNADAGEVKRQVMK